MLPAGKALGQDESDTADKSVKWALLADTHVAENKEEVYNGSYPFRNLRDVAPTVAAAKPSGVMIVGDVARLDGRLGDYRLVKQLMKPVAEKAPVFLGLGNHDHRDNFLKIFPQSPAKGKRQTVVGKHVLVVDQAPVVRFVLLDSLHRVNVGAGNLGKQQVDWLNTFLMRADDVPTVVCVHHTLGRRGGDLQDTAQLLAALDSAKQVKALVYGHSHRFGVTRRKGMHLINLPPIGYRFDSVSPLGWLDAEFHSKGASLTLRTVESGADGDGKKTSLAWR